MQNQQATRHFEITQSSNKTSSIDYSHFIEVNSTTAGASAVSFYEYERRRQDNMSLIKILKPDFVSNICRRICQVCEIDNNRVIRFK